MLDLLWRTSFRWKLHPKQVTGDTAYGTMENIAAVERAGIRAYVPLTGAGKARPYFSKEEFAYDPEQDLYLCPAGKLLSRAFRSCRRTPIQDRGGTCDACSLRPNARPQERPPSPAPQRRALRGSGQELPRHLRLREGAAQDGGYGWSRCSLKPRTGTVYAGSGWQAGEGEHRGAADRLRTEHKEVGSGSGAGPAETGTGGGPAPTGSGESLQASFDWTVALRSEQRRISTG